MQLSDLANTLQKYMGASATNPPETAEQDFQQVAQHAPAGHLANGLSEAFRSDQTPPFGQMVANLFANSDGQQRAGILNQILGSVGAGALSSGVLGGLAGMLGGRQQVTPEQADQISPETVGHLAQHAQQQNPSIVDEASNYYAQHPKLVQALGAGALALVMSRMSRS